MCILQNQCNLRLLKYKESSMNTKFDYWKCNKMYEKAQLRSDFRKKYLLGWGSNPRKWLLSCSAISRMQACYIEFILVYLINFSSIFYSFFTLKVVLVVIYGRPRVWLYHLSHLSYSHDILFVFVTLYITQY